MAEALIFVYVVVTLLVFGVMAADAQHMRSIPGGRPQAVKSARWALAAPLWPITGLALLVAWCGGIVRMALGGPDAR